MPIRIQSNYKWNFIHILRFHDDIPEGMLNRYLFGGGDVASSPKGRKWAGILAIGVTPILEVVVSNSRQGRC